MALASRTLHPDTFRVRTLAAALTLASLMSFAAAALTQPLPVTELAYSAKYLCGLNLLIGPDIDLALPANCTDYTVVEVHNPHTVPVTFTYKVVRDFPLPFEIVTPPTEVSLAPNESWEWTCSDLIAVPGRINRGFIEVLSQRQLKVVAVYKETCGWNGLVKSASIAKKSSPVFFFNPFVRHSGTFLYGDETTAGGDIIRHETLISLVNMSSNPMNCNITISDAAGVVHLFPMNLTPKQYGQVTGADLPAGTPLPFRGAVTVEYVSPIALLECEEIIQKHVIAGAGGATMSHDVVEVQPIPRR